MAKASRGGKSGGNKRAARGDERAQQPRQTKKQIAIGRKVTRQNRIIWLSVAGLIAIILAIAVSGLLTELVIRPSTAVAKVNGNRIRADEYQALLTYRRSNLHGSIQDLQDGLQTLDPNQEGSEFLISFYQQQLEQLQSSLAAVPETALDELIDDELIREQAEEMDLAVTEGEVDQAIDSDLRRLVSPEPQQPITDTAQIATPTPIPQERIDEVYQAVLDSLGLTDRQFRAIVERGLLRTKVQEELASRVPTTGLVAHVQIIQSDAEEEEIAARERLEAGEDFATVASEVSTDFSSAEGGGDLGWIAIGQLANRYGQELEDSVFSIAIDELGFVQSNDKYYLVIVAERDENGDLPPEELARRQNSALADWLSERTDTPDLQIERLLKPEQIPPDSYPATLLP